MTTIESGQDVITKFKIFIVSSDKIDLMVETLRQAAQTVKDVPGCISMNLHVSLDRIQVANYAQC